MYLIVITLEVSIEIGLLKFAHPLNISLVSYIPVAPMSTPEETAVRDISLFKLTQFINMPRTFIKDAGSQEISSLNL